MTPPGGGANRPLVSYQPFINALGVQCAPSHTLFNGALPEATGLNALLARGWAVAIPDHLGPTSAYGAARLGGRLVLDGLRAAQRAPLGLAASPIAMVGYSGGGMATEWAAALAPTYAPELNIVGAAAGGVPVDIGQIADDVGNTPNPQFGLGFAASMGLEREYPGRLDLSDSLNPAGSALRDAIANSCTDDIIAAGAGKSYPAVTDPSFRQSASVQSVLAENSLIDYPGVPRTPIFQWHGSNDQLVDIDSVKATVAKNCAAGAIIDFDVIAGGDHGTSIAAGLLPAWNYLGDRFAGIPAPRTC